MSPTSARETIQAAIARIAGIEPPAPDADIFLAGFVSTDALELLVELEDVFGISIPDDRFVEARTVNSLASMVAELSPGGAA